MTRPNQQAIERFMRITGVSEAVAVQRLEEYGGDVIDALNEHLNEGDRNVAGEVRETPIDVMDWNQYTPQAGHAHYSHQDEQTNKILSDTSRGGSAKEEQLRPFSVLIEYVGQMCQEERDIERAISLPIETPEQEGAQHLQGDVSAPIVGPPESSGVELGKITASNGRFQAGQSFFQDEAEDAREQPLTRKRSRPTPLGSMDLAKNADFIETTSMSSSGSRESINNSQHNISAIHEEELGGISSLERDVALMLKALMLGGIPKGNGYVFPNDIMQNREQQDDELLKSLQADREKEGERKNCRRNVEEAKAAREEERRREEELQKKLQKEKELERRLAAKEAALPPEPSVEDKNVVTLLVKMPDENYRGRRFLKSDNLQSLFDFIDIGRVVEPGTYRLVRPYPRRSYGDGEGTLALNEFGMTDKQQVLFLELI